MCKHYAKKDGGMNRVQKVKIDRNAFNRGVEDMLTLRQLRDVVGSVIKSNKTKSGSVVSRDGSTERSSDVRPRQSNSRK